MPAKYKQGDLILLKDPIKLPDGTELPHPVLIISSNTSNDYECFYTGVMMSSTSYQDRFTFKLNDSMFDSPLEKKDCQFRMYIIVSFKENDVVKFVNRMKQIHLKALLVQINNLIFCI